MIEAIRHFVSQRMLRSAAAVSAAASPGPSEVQLAACALLLELAYADGEFSVQERAHVEDAIRRHFGMDDATAAELLALAHAERQESIDYFQFTRLIAQHYDLGQKMVLAELMWGVILADGRIGDHEAYLVRKLASLLQLEPGYLAEARRTAGGQR